MRKRTYRLCLIVVVMALPAIVTHLLVYFHFGATLFDFIPYYNDEVHYWHEILTFSRVGFEGGYYTIEENPAYFNFSHFGPHGPMFPILYGVIGHFVGWHFYSAPIFNLILVMLALGFFGRITKLGNKQLIIVGLFVLTFWPLLLLLPSNMQASIHYAIAIILAGVFYVLLSKEGDISPPFKIFSLVFIVLVSLIRPTWSLLLVPFLILSSKQKSPLNLLINLVKATVLIAAIFLLYQYLAAPFPGEGFRFAKILLFEISAEEFVDYAWGNLANLISFQNSHLLEILQRYQVLFLLVVFCIGGVTLLRRRDNATEEPDTYAQLRWQIFFHIYNLGGILAATVLLYIVGSWGDYRVVASHLLITVLLLIALQTKDYLVGVIIVSNLVLSSVFSGAFQELRSDNFIYDYQDIASFHETTKDFLVYKENQNPWCNTLLSVPYPSHEFYRQFVFLPAGVGVSTVLEPDRIQLPLKSKYILVEADVQRIADKYGKILNSGLNLQFLGSAPAGNVYLNLDSKCE